MADGASTTVLTIDSDAHVLECEGTWEYLAASEQEFRPQIASITTDETRQHWVLDGRVCGFRFATLTERALAERSEQSGRGLVTPAAARDLRDVEIRLAHMDQLGIDIQVLHNTLWLEQVSDRPEVETALCRSWNRWMAESVEPSRGRLRWCCVVSVLGSPEEMRSEIEFARRHGAVGVAVRPFERDLMMTDPQFFPVYETAAALGMAVVVHIANGDPELARKLKARPSTESERAGGFDPRLFATFRIPTVAACFRLLTSGIPSVFPEIRWGFIEASAGWIPWISSEVSSRFKKTPTAESNPFSDANVFVTTEMSDDHRYILDQVGPNVLVIGTDYGHTDPSSDLDAIAAFRKLTSLTEAEKTAVLYDNARRLYGIDDVEL